MDVDNEERAFEGRKGPQWDRGRDVADRFSRS